MDRISRHHSLQLPTLSSTLIATSKVSNRTNIRSSSPETTLSSTTSQDLIGSNSQEGTNSTSIRATDGSYEPPAGLMCLTTLDELFISRSIDCLTCYATYRITNQEGDALLTALEVSDACGPLVLQVHDPNDRNKTLMLVDHERSCLRHLMTVSCPPSDLIGFVQKVPLTFGLQFSIHNQNGNIIYSIARTGQGCSLSSTNYGVFLEPVKLKKGEFRQVRKGGHNYLNVQFPPMLDVRHKALVLTAAVQAYNRCSWN